MKRFILTTALLFSSFSLYAAPHDELINTIIESDYENFMKAYTNNTFSQESKAYFEDLATRMIMVRGQWMAAHASRPQMSKDLIAANIWLVSSWLVGCSSFGLAVIAAIEKKYELTIFSTIFGVGIIAFAVYCNFSRIVAAWQKPKKLFTDAVRIKDALAINI